MKLLSRLRLQYTYLNKRTFSKRTFRHGFNDTVNPVCPCGADVETTEHFLLHCFCFSTQWYELFDNIWRLDPSFSKFNAKEKVAYLLYGSTSNSSSLNKHFIKLNIKFLKSNGCFNEPLIFDQWNVKIPKILTTEAAIRRCSWNSKM